MEIGIIGTGGVHGPWRAVGRGPVTGSHSDLGSHLPRVDWVPGRAGSSATRRVSPRCGPMTTTRLLGVHCSVTPWAPLTYRRTPRQLARPTFPGFQRVYLVVGQIPIFRDEDLDYAQRLSRAGVTVEFHLRPGVPHEFETFAHATDIARRAVADRLRVLGAISCTRPHVRGRVRRTNDPERT
jgi:acetyl esterase/lipase